ncbi:MAG TPA: hypothetical protein VK672_02335 [Solirubrobacteraceae bacterium]|nr:hypothetical protein [Solirubrobacteraceae bacterium]
MKAGAVVVRVVSPLACPPVGLVSVFVVVVALEEEGVVPVVVVCWVVVPDGAALEIDTVFVPPDPHPLRANRLASMQAGNLARMLGKVALPDLAPLLSRVAVGLLALILGTYSCSPAVILAAVSSLRAGCAREASVATDRRRASYGSRLRQAGDGHPMEAAS